MGIWLRLLCGLEKALLPFYKVSNFSKGFILKAMIFVITAFLSVPAFADYFGCDLKVGHDRTITAEAEYRGREISVSSKGWTCSGVIDGNMMVTATLTSPQANANGVATGRGSARTGFGIQDVNDEEGEFIYGSCLCSLR